MLPTPLRFNLRQWPDFFSNPEVVKTSHLTLLFQKLPQPGLRAAIVVKKSYGGAVQRAKIRRIIRSALIGLWKEQAELFQQPVALVILPRGGRAKQSEYQEELEQALSHRRLA